MCMGNDQFIICISLTRVGFQGAGVLGRGAGTLKQRSVAHDGPFGKAGTSLWLCGEHEELLDRWNASPVKTKDLVSRAIEISHAHCAKAGLI